MMVLGVVSLQSEANVRSTFATGTEARREVNTLYEHLRRWFVSILIIFHTIIY